MKIGMLLTGLLLKKTITKKTKTRRCNLLGLDGALQLQPHAPNCMQKADAIHTLGLPQLLSTFILIFGMQQRGR